MTKKRKSLRINTAAILGKGGYTIDTRRQRGAEALIVLATTDYDLVLTDLQWKVVTAFRYDHESAPGDL